MNDLPFRYYLITNRHACAPRSLTDVVDEACRHGIKAVQLREKDLDGRPLLKLAQRLREVTKQHNALLFINDRVDVALVSGADGVHCREKSLSPTSIQKLSKELIIGASVHSVERAQKASTEGADFLLFGPVFHTPSKAHYGQPQGLQRLKEVVANTQIPVFAVGGITPERGTSCLEAGATGVAGISSIMKSSSVEKTVNHWNKILDKL